MLPEVAMVGRSNVGKSSLINALVGRAIARTSAAPGKTRLANVYRVSPVKAPAFYLIDLPGYGYARGGQAAVQAFEAVTTAYFERVSRARRASGHEGATPSFAGALLLVDSRHPELDADQRAWAWLGALELPRHLIATKLDKLTRAERHRHLEQLQHVYECPPVAVSVSSGEGLEELWILIAKLLRQPPPPPV